MDKTKWKSIMLPRQLEEMLDTFSKSELANSLGFTNKSQIAAVSIREFLRNYAMYNTFLDFLDINENEIKLMDYNVGKVVKVSFDSELRTLYCLEHKSETCKHTQFISGLPRFGEFIDKHSKVKGMRPKKRTDDEMVENIRLEISRSLVNSKKNVSNEKLKKIIKILEN